MASKRNYRAVRLAAGFGIRELERRTGINRGRLSMIERGIPPTADEHRLILDALNQRETTNESGI